MPRQSRETKDEPTRSEKKRFREQLCDERTARSSQREANGDFVLTLGCARQKERNNIRAGDQQSREDGAEEQPERPVVNPDGAFLEWLNANGEDARRFSKLLSQLGLHGSQIGAGLFYMTPGLRPPITVNSCFPGARGKKCPQGWGTTNPPHDFGKRKRGRHYAHDGVHMPIKSQVFPEWRMDQR